MSPFLRKNGVESPHHTHSRQVLEGSCAKAADQILETKLASGMGGVERGGGIQANSSICVPVTPVCSPSPSRVTFPREGVLQPLCAPSWGVMGVCLSLGQLRSQSEPDAQQYLNWFLLFLGGRGTICSIQSAPRSVGGITCTCRKGIVAGKWQQKCPGLGEVGNSRRLYCLICCCGSPTQLLPQFSSELWGFS